MKRGTHVTVREYAHLTTSEVTPSSGNNPLDQATISESAFDWLCRLSAQAGRTGACLVQIEGRKRLKLDNYVGVVETPCGTRIEILPKHVDGEGDAEGSRKLLRKMLCAALDLKPKESGPTSIELFNKPLSEWVIRQFLQHVDHLVKRGIRFDYIRLEEERRFLRGQFDVARQMRQPPERQHLFHVRHDEFLPDRAENRLLKSALEKVCRHTRDPDNWRLARELVSLFSEISPTPRAKTDFALWRADRTMAHYAAVKPWCQLILGDLMPLSIVGDWHGISLLFPMEKLFERFVAASIRKKLVGGSTLKTQPASEWLCQHRDSGFFQLQPDLLLTNGPTKWVMDSKWKLLNSADRVGNYGISQADFYQLFAYGHKYLDGNGMMALIYPKTPTFAEPLPVFDLGNGLTLWALPFDLEEGRLLLPPVAVAWPFFS